MKYKWVQSYITEWHLILNYDGINQRNARVASAYWHGGGWRGVVYSTYKSPNEVVFLEPDNLVDMKLLLETTVALRVHGDGV